MALIPSWRWFGPQDPVALAEIRQTGATAVVTALHQIPVGEVWSCAAIEERKQMIEAARLAWLVVESVPVHEAIKQRSGDCARYIDTYKQTLANLGQSGIRIVCYNFMPVLDWSRTELGMLFPDGARSSGFRLHEFAAFDLFILRRPGAGASYSARTAAQAGEFFGRLAEEDRARLESTILLGLPGSGETLSLEQLQQSIDRYRTIDRSRLKENLFAFLREIVPAAEEAGVRLAIHPDDPPWSLFGLPRVVSTCEDLTEILAAVDSPHNGLTFCSGSLGAGHFNDVALMAEKFAARIHFAHPRNVVRGADLSFHEERLLEGEIDIYRVMKALVVEDLRRQRVGRAEWDIPFRPDHGHHILEDSRRDTYPGYPLYGRLKNLAELRGLEAGIRRSMG
jgi:mannonate dehydratase